MATGATAADITMPGTTVVAPPPPPRAAPAFAWDRFYVGAYAGSWINCCGWMAGAYAGKNFQRNNLVFGVEGMAGFYNDGGYSFEAYLLARLGFALGARALLYGSIGAGWDTGFVPAAAAGIEVGLRDSLSLRAQVLLYDAFNSPDIAVHGGVAWHFGGR